MLSPNRWAVLRSVLGNPSPSGAATSAASTTPASARLTPHQAEALRTRLGRLTETVVPERRAAVTSAAGQVRLTSLLLRNADTRLRSESVNTLERARDHVVRRLNAATSPEQEIALRGELESIQDGLRAALEGAPTQGVRAAAQSAVQSAVARVNHALNPDQEIHARTELYALEGPLHEADRGYALAQERVSSARSSLDNASQMLSRAMGNANDLAARLGLTAPYPGLLPGQMQFY
ncbi:MAG: hypothetical protein M3Y59_12455 [Myxococcota bacterium]|nr:hypothetical protein [Myxococcota bacterium]